MNRAHQDQELGRGRLVERLAHRISDHFRRGSDDSVDKSLVIGLFGEWGSGKSWLLERLKLHFGDERHRLVQRDNGHEGVIVPILFNPWRFEAEEHLIIPMLMKTHDVLSKCALDSTTGEEIKAKADYFLKSALAFASAWKFKIGIPNIGSCEFDPGKGIKAQDSLLKHCKTDDNLNSYYYDFENGLKEVTDKGVHLLFLIDDIDRCLPERAVQMLEAIKLFLDVPECVFVLGIDDEVVERGIRHRYRDYNHDPDGPDYQNGGNGSTEQSAALPPITGMEYLEKIIHLPIRLPLMRKRQVEDFLINRFPTLFETGVEAQLDGRSMAGLHPGEAKKNNQLLELFQQAVPLIPRKLIRAGELLSFLSQLPGNFQPDRLLLARLVLLQLFAPEVFLHLRRVNHHLLINICQWQEAGELSLTGLENKNSPKPAEAKTDPDIWQSEERPLIGKLLAAARNRVNFDPCRVFYGLRTADLPDNLLDYFHLIGEQDGASSALGSSERLSTTALTDQRGFIADLFSEREASWRKSLDMEELQGKALDDKTFAEILAKLDSDQQKSTDLEWLEALSQRLTRAHRHRLLDHLGLWDRLLKQLDTDDIKRRAQVGRTIGRLGDRRPGVTVKRHKSGEPIVYETNSRQHGQPDIDWLAIPASNKQFKMGDEPRVAVEVNDFHISRYPITNAQYRCFIEAGGYEDKSYWPTEAAQNWLKGGEADEELIMAYPEKRREGLREFLAKDNQRQAPRFWNDAKWNNPNHPVVGICWFEAMAFCRWLSRIEFKQVRLPGEEEWEYAARGVQGLDYGWGDEFDHSLGNTEESGLEATTAVGLYPAGKAVGPGPEAKQFGLHDMSGNVWEWTANRWGTSINEPKFTNDNWHDQAKEVREDPQVNELRVLRGGSWVDSRDGCRCSIRGRSIPNDRLNVMGFRVVFSLAAGS